LGEILFDNLFCKELESQALCSFVKKFALIGIIFVLVDVTLIKTKQHEIHTGKIFSRSFLFIVFIHSFFLFQK